MVAPASWGPSTSFNVGPGLGAGWQMLSGTKWGGALGTGVTLTYSFPKDTGTWATDYGSKFPKEYVNGNWFGFSAQEIAAAKAALADWSASANIKFAHVADTSTNVGEIRFAYSYSVSPGAAAHAYYPWKSAAAGDAWFSPGNFNADRSFVPKGSYDYLTIVHELGHSLGLKHSFESPALPDSLDNYFYSIMSYSASRFADDNYASFYPTTPMFYDLLAIQKLYGKNTTINKTNTVYTFNDGNRYFETINDAGGADRIVYNGWDNAIINLNPGKFSSVSELIYFTGGSSRATVAIGPGVIIERAFGSNGNDTLYGNASGNLLNGNGGNDKLYGAAGDDSLYGQAGDDLLQGGPGNDKLYGGAGADTFLFNTALNRATNIDRILDFNVADDTIRLENSIFKKLPNGILPASYFKKAAVAGDANDYVLYHASTGNLIYDANGSAPGGAIVFAILAKGLAMKNTDFFTI